MPIWATSADRPCRCRGTCAACYHESCTDFAGSSAAGACLHQEWLQRMRMGLQSALLPDIQLRCSTQQLLLCAGLTACLRDPAAGLRVRGVPGRRHLLLGPGGLPVAQPRQRGLHLLRFHARPRVLAHVLHRAARGHCRQPGAHAPPTLPLRYIISLAVCKEPVPSTTSHGNHACIAFM